MVEGKYVLLLSRPAGYELVEREGEPPARGSEVDLGEDGGGRFTVVKIGPSPLPEDDRPCAYLQAR